ncbi:MAG: zf-HC2 domain-containing protein [Acidobacteriota bacterium]
MSTDRDGLDELLRDALHERSVDGDAEHVDDVELARYLAGRLHGAARRRLEDHLADCASCRELAVVAVGAADDLAPRGADLPTAGGWFGLLARPLLVAATVALLVVGVARLVPGPGTPGGDDRVQERAADHTPVEPAAPLEIQPELPPELAASVRRALAGGWPEPIRFDGFVGDRGAIERASAPAARGRPVARTPRWETIRTRRPTFGWSLGQAVDPSIEEVEVLVVDAGEELVVSLSQAQGASAAYPDDALPLEPGGVYAWRVGLRRDGAWSTSEFVPFRVASADELAALDDALRAAGSSKLARAVVLATHGVHGEALAVLETAAPSDGVERFARSLRVARRMADGGGATDSVDSAARETSSP